MTPFVRPHPLNNAVKGPSASKYSRPSFCLNVPLTNRFDNAP